MRIIVSGGGTAGHIYPAISVVKALENELGKDNCTSLFVGARGKMEERIIPNEGYEIKTLPVRGLVRTLSFSTIKTLFMLINSFISSLSIIRKFKPDMVLGFGGYASLPIMLAAKIKGVDIYIWEGNSFAGLTNKLLNRYAKKAFVSFEGMERFFDKEKIIVSGNPIRDSFSSIEKKSKESLEYYGFNKEQKVFLIVGGSLGAKALNEAMLSSISMLVERKDIGVIWQTGRNYYDSIVSELEGVEHSNIFIAPFIDNMKLAYGACDVIACRSGASTVTEVARCNLAAIFVPSSGVTDDHQTKNAEVFKRADAAELIHDCDLAEKLMPTLLELLSNDEKRNKMSEKIGEFACRDAAKIIAKELINDLKK